MWRSSEACCQAKRFLMWRSWQVLFVKVVTTFTKRTCDRCDCQGRNVVRRLPGHVWPPMFEPEVLRKQMNLIEESTCEIVGIFWRSCSNSAPPEWFGTLGFATLAPDRYAYGCCNISVGVALDVLFTTNGMWAKKNSHIYLARKGYNRVIIACDLYCCLLLQCEALRTCRSGFPIATQPSLLCKLEHQVQCQNFFLGPNSFHAWKPCSIRTHIKSCISRTSVIWKVGWCVSYKFSLKSVSILLVCSTIPSSISIFTKQKLENSGDALKFTVKIDWPSHRKSNNWVGSPQGYSPDFHGSFKQAEQHIFWLESHSNLHLQDESYSYL